MLIAVEIALAAGVLSNRAGAQTQAGAAHFADLSARPLPASDRSGIAALLARHASALLRRDRAAFLADTDPRAPAFRGRQGTLFARLSAVSVTSWSYATRGAGLPVPPEVLARYGGDVWASEVTLAYALTGFERRPSAVRQYFTFVRRAGHWYLGNDDDLRATGHLTSREPWELGPVSVLTAPQGLVIADPAAEATAREIKDMLVLAQVRVSALWRERPRPPVIVVARSAAEIEAMVPGVGDLAQIAAVTAAETGAAPSAPAAERIIINPIPFAALRPAARQAVLTHELTHVASVAMTSESTPMWLSEGMADFAGNSTRTEAPAVIARQLAIAVRAGRVPELLPSEGDFDPSAPRLSEAYDSAWLACRLIAERFGSDALVRLYRIVAAGPGNPDAAVDSGLRSVLGMTTEQFTSEWRAYVRAQLA